MRHCAAIVRAGLGSILPGKIAIELIIATSLKIIVLKNKVIIRRFYYRNLKLKLPRVTDRGVICALCKLLRAAQKRFCDGIQGQRSKDGYFVRGCDHK